MNTDGFRLIFCKPFDCRKIHTSGFGSFKVGLDINQLLFCEKKLSMSTSNKINCVG